VSLRRIPASLAALMAVALLLGLTWSVLTPAFQAPDEQSHFAYTQYLAETGKLPGRPEAPIYSTEHINAAAAVLADQVAATTSQRPEWSERRYERWKDEHAGDARGDGGGPQSAAGYPPLSYAWEALGYRVARGDFFDRLSAARTFSALWLPITVLGTWLLAGELFGRRRLLQVAAAAIPALLPMSAFVSGSVSPDGMLYALWSLVLWLGVKTLRGGLMPTRAAALTGLVAAACLTKATFFALIPPLALVLAVGVARAPRRLANVLAAAGVIVAWVVLAQLFDRPVGGDLAVNPPGAKATSIGGLASYFLNFYVPRPDFWSRGYPPLDTWVRGVWANFGWLEVQFDRRVYLGFAALTLAILGGAATVLWRARRRLDLAVTGFLALTVVALLAGLHWTDYRQSLIGLPFMQGRYLLPVAALFGTATAAALTLVPAARRAAMLGVGLAVLVTVQLASIALMLERFYA
jgi:hypothetical protein